MNELELATIQGSDFLEEGQNLLDQVPFRELIAQAIELDESKLTTKKILERSLCLISKSYDFKGLRDDSNGSTAFSRLPYYISLLREKACDFIPSANRANGTNIKKPASEDYKKSLSFIIQLLDENYPYWLQYLSKYSQRYLNDGTPKVIAGKIESYIHFIAEIIKEDDPNYGLREVIADAFPGGIRRSLVIAAKHGRG